MALRDVLCRNVAALRARRFATTDVAVVGSGAPGRGMGWYHAKQILDGEVPSAKLTDVVEPWFMGGGSTGPGSAAFNAFRTSAEAAGVSFHASVTNMSKPSDKKMAMICSRTADMPAHFGEVIASGCSHIFLEKPGAPTVEELETMSAASTAAGVGVFMGFNKNVTKYVKMGREALAKVPGGEFTLVHHNSYTREDIDECFERCSEGILKNMAIHELACLVTFFGVNVDTLASVVADKHYSICETLKGPSSGKMFTDFSKIGFTMTSKAGAKCSVYADRCGGFMPGGAMADGAMVYSLVSKDGIVHFRAIIPNAVVRARAAKNPDFMSYFHLQHDDYVTLKERCCAHIAAGEPGFPEGIATLQTGIDALKLVEMLKPELEAQLLA